MEVKKFRVIDGGRSSPGIEKRIRFENRKTLLEDNPLNALALKYRQTLASNYAERKIKEVGSELDPKDILKDAVKLAEQARIEVEEWKGDFGRTAKRLKSEFEEVRQTAAYWFACMAYDREIFTIEEARQGINALITNFTAESKQALSFLGISAEDIAHMKFADPEKRESVLERILNTKKQD